MALGRPVVTGLKALTVGEGVITARREAIGGGWETYDLPMPAIVGVKEGINLPRYPSVPGRLRAKKKEVERISVGAASSGPAAAAGTALGPTKALLRLPEQVGSQVEILGRGAEAAPAVVDLLERIGVLAR